MLSYNGYSVRLVDKCISEAISKYIEAETQRQGHLTPIHSENDTIHKLFYQNSMYRAYKEDEKILRSILIGGTAHQCLQGIS